jgi:phosphatidylglycerol---prolipoprotein diacylglyceryl transferase
LMISLGSLLGVIWFLKRTPQEDEGLAINTTLIGLVAGFIGARLFHVIYEEPAFYLKDLRLVFEVWRGGFVYYGGLVTGVWFAYSYLKKRTMRIEPWLDRAALPLGLAYAVGRLGCFFNGCCYGRVCDLPWGLKFPSHIGFGMALLPRHPTQLYAAIFEMISILILMNLERRRWFSWKSQLFWTWASLHAVNRLIMEHWRDDDRGFMPAGISISTLISLVLLAFAARTLWKHKKAVKKPA